MSGQVFQNTQYGASPVPRGYSFLDFDKFDRQTMRSTVVQQELLEAFIQLTPPLAAELREVCSRNDMTSTIRLLHKLKSSTALFCTDSFYQSMHMLEENARRPWSPDYGKAMQEMLDGLEHLVAETKTLFKG
jgi:HPt (histidine-containing phosphotransfer) domain-containing protein